MSDVSHLNVTPSVAPPNFDVSQTLSPSAVPEPLDQCSVCGGTDFSLHDPDCSTCMKPRGAPNVLLASRREEQEALRSRARSALVSASGKGVSDALIQLSKDSLGLTSAVLNVSLEYAITLFGSAKQSFSPYARQINGMSRRPASFEDDAKRRTVENWLFGSYGDNIIYAALSTHGANGLISYGPVTLKLRDVAISERASVLEENSYSFHSKWSPMQPPFGYRAPWGLRHLLIAAKLAGEVNGSTKLEDILLKPGNMGRSDDEFIEVHIYGTFNRTAVEHVTVDASGFDSTQRILLRVLKDKIDGLSPIPQLDIRGMS